ncbi:IS3 family transposase [Pedobacter roseus]|uniref:Transposase n=1 Tax=Pedobacter roseus TaxID=336820 RepID=A0A7G9QDH4_9SPHI|nr:IS3 family transposase [Pedobacter roseus]QNN41399.1 transposase [Pedobacter roseus]
MLLQAADMARSTFYYHIQKNKKADKYDHLKIQIKNLYDQHKGRLGYRRMVYALRELGFHLNDKTVLRLMKSMGLKSVIRVKKYKTYRGSSVKWPRMYCSVTLEQIGLSKNGQQMLQSLK